MFVHHAKAIANPEAHSGFETALNVRIGTWRPIPSSAGATPTEQLRARKQAKTSNIVIFGHIPSLFDPKWKMDGSMQHRPRELVLVCTVSIDVPDERSWAGDDDVGGAPQVQRQVADRRTARALHAKGHSHSQELTSHRV